MRFGKKGKLSPRYIGPFEILKKVGTVSYQLALPPYLQNIHDVFHISVLKAYHLDICHVLAHESIEVQSDLTYEEKPIRITDRKVQKLRNKEIRLFKVIWRNQSIEEATWESEDDMRKSYPSLFYVCTDFEDAIL
ncbi:uncharacterized protein LOC141695057 [Apium graveolens]|uniref:uncharacterized protein LOC141695057 n=1 Tax=Apium graveolens TaxID=4045 RepID=UPI003D7A9C10